MTSPNLIAKGKTKRILTAGDTGCIIMEYKDTMTAHDGEKQVEVPGLGALRTTQCSQMQMAWEAAGLPTTFQGQINDTQMLHLDCSDTKLNLEFVVRTFAMPKGSYCKRYPHMMPETEGGFPRRLNYVTEVFHKDAIVWEDDGSKKLISETKAVANYPKNMRETDPLIQVSSCESNSSKTLWGLYPQKQPLFEQSKPALIIEPEVSVDILKAGQQLAVKAYKVLEHLIDQLGHTLCDFKVELALIDGQLYLTDSISLDEVRIGRGGDPRVGLDKQAYRDTGDVAKVSEDYAEMAEALAAVDVEAMFKNWQH